MSLVPYSKLPEQPRVDLARAYPLPRPLRIFIEPGNACNFACTWCPESFEDYKEKAGGLSMMTMEQFEMIAAQIKEMGQVARIDFYMMGEPFLNRRLTDFFLCAKQNNLAKSLMVSTNGTQVKRERWGGIITSGLTYMRVSIYGADQHTHEKRTRSTISLEQIKQNVFGLRRERDLMGASLPWIYVKMISTTPEENALFLKEWDGVGDEVAIEPAHNWDDDTKINLSGMNRETLLAQPHFGQRREVCTSPFYSLVIHADLRVGVCSADWSKGIVVGDLSKGDSLSEIWRGEKMRNIQRLHMLRRKDEISSCKNCTFLHLAPDNVDALRMCKVCNGGPLNVDTGVCPDCGSRIV